MPETIPENLEIIKRHEKCSENHKNSRKIPGDGLRHEQPK
jgi:hypothetical protein